MAKYLDKTGLSHFWEKIKTKFYKKGDTFPEAYLEWGGRNLSASYAPIDAAMVPELGANRFALIPAAGVVVEYSRDGGVTWTNYGASNASISRLFSEIGEAFFIGKASASNKATAAYQLRVTITTDVANVYTVLNKFVIFCSTNGSTGSYVTIDKALKDSETTWVNVVNKQGISGWSGYNIINVPAGIETYGNKPATQYSKIRFTFGCTGGSTTYNGLRISKILGFGGVGWTTPNTLAKYGRIYTYDAGQNVTFPSSVTASDFLIGAASLSAIKNAIAPEWQPNVEYEKRQLVWHNGNLYASKYNYNSASSFDAANFRETNVGSEISGLQADIDEL